jgi:hypothetical protein
MNRSKIFKLIATIESRSELFRRSVSDMDKLKRLYFLLDETNFEFDLDAYRKKSKHKKQVKKSRNHYKREQKRIRAEKHRSKEYLDRANNDLNPFLLAVSCIDRVEIRCGLVRRLDTGETFSGKEFIRLCKNVGASQFEINLIAKNLTKLGLIDRNSSTKKIENNFKIELLKFNNRVAGSKRENILTVGNRLGLSDDESYNVYKKLYNQERIERRSIK